VGVAELLPDPRGSNRLSHATEPRAAAILSELPERFVEGTALGSDDVVAPPIEPVLPCPEEADNSGQSQAEGVAED
jgi:hypothetical protein